MHMYIFSKRYKYVLTDWILQWYNVNAYAN